MRMLYLRKKMLTLVAFMYAGVLAASITFAAVTGQIDFVGTITTSADLNVVLAGLPTASARTDFGSEVLSMQVSDMNRLTLDILLRAPGDQVSVVFQLLNDGNLPAEMEAPIMYITGVTEVDGDNVVEIHPVMVEGFTEDGVLDFEDLDGFWLGVNVTSPEFGIAFIWDEDVHYVTPENRPLTFTIEFPFIIGELTPPPEPVPPVTP